MIEAPAPGRPLHFQRPAYEMENHVRCATSSCFWQDLWGSLTASAAAPESGGGRTAATNLQRAEHRTANCVTAGRRPLSILFTVSFSSPVGLHLPSCSARFVV